MAIHGTFSSLEMQSKKRYKFYTCLDILGEHESFRSYKGFRIIFPKILYAI